MPDSEIFERDVAWIHEADFIVAEVTQPSLGVGYELGLAESVGKPIICLFRETEDRRLSAMIAGNSKLDFTQNPGKVMDDITFVRSHWWLVSEGFSLSTANSDVQKLPATLYHRIADSLAYAA